MLRGNMDLKTAQVRLGHSDLQLTLTVYAQGTTDRDAEAAERLGDKFMRATPGGCVSRAHSARRPIVRAISGRLKRRIRRLSGPGV